MLFISLTMLGYVSYKQLSVELFPNPELPTLTINVSSRQDFDPAFVESEVIIPIEGAISSVGGVDRIQTDISSSRSSIQVEFKNNVNIKTTTLRMEEKMKEVSTSLPDGFTVRVQRGADFASLVGSNFMTLQVRGVGGADRVRNIVDERITSDLENIDGVAAVNVFGGRERAIEIRLNVEACEALNLTSSRIANILSSQAQERVFVGNAIEGERQMFVHVSSTYSRISDIENIIVAPGPILLKDVATIFFDLKEETSFSRVNGRESVRITLMSDAQSNMIELANRAKDVIDDLNERLLGFEVEIVIDSNAAETIENNINQIIELALTGGLLAVFVLWFFLKNIKLVLLIGLSIPVSIYTAFNLFYATGLSINSLTLVGMALAVGLLLDNSIVVLENIYRLSGSGMNPERSVTQGTKEVWRSILAATLTTVTVFLPFLFTENFLIKLYGTHIGMSIVSMLMVSMAVALLFIPMVTYVLLRFRKGKIVFYEKVSLSQRPVQIYMVLLKTCMRNPGTTVFGAVVLLCTVLILALSSNVSTLREVDVDRFAINVTMRTGTTLENTDKVARMLEELLIEAEIPELQDVITSVNAEQAMLMLVLVKDYKKLSNRGMSDIQTDVQTRLPRIDGAQINISSAMGGGGGGNRGAGGASGMESFMGMLGIGSSQERVILRGADFDMMQLVAEDLRFFLDNQDFIRTSRVSFPSRQPEVRLNFDQIMLNSFNISRNNITTGLSEMNTEFSSGTRFKVGGEYYDIIIRNEPTAEEEEGQQQRSRDIPIERLQTVQVENAAGGLHHLPDIATITRAFGRSRITRVNQDKQLNVTYSFIRDVEQSKPLLEGYREEINEMIAGYNLPAGIAIEVLHQENQFDEFKFLILAAILLIFIILACVFESLATPFVIMFTVPLAAIGSLLALLITGNTNLMNTNILTGFLILLGIVVNNGILLIDYSNILRTRGYGRERALIMAGLSRVRPILITSITTIIAMLPMAMGDSEYSGLIGAPFAVTVIGGLACSTLLTLLVIPTALMSLENALAWHRDLPLKIKLIHLGLAFLGIALIHFYVNETLWQVIYFLLVVVGIPGVTYFAQTSLRLANADVIDKEQDIHIVVSNLVKIYDRAGRFNRQWGSGLDLNERLGLNPQFHTFKDFIGVAWQFLLWSFLIYFTYFYLESKTWIFFLSFAIYALTLYLWQSFYEFLYHRFPNRFVRFVDGFIFWGIPIMIITILQRNLDNNAMTAIIGSFWVIGLTIFVSSQYLYDKDINIERISGRFAGFRRNYFRFVKSVPIIGKRRRPFKALRGISFEIKTGMFGLLGPNGAGKSTFMRIITGILEQSYGSIWINGLDTLTYREELQSLIGFLPQEFGTYENMTAWEFLDYQAIMKGLTDKTVRNERLDYVLKSVHMFERKDHKISSFSGGMKQRIGIALILLHLPRILVVDEPTAGLDPRERIRFRNLLVELSKNRIVIFSTHIIEDIASSCNQVVVINKGDLKYLGDPMEMVGMATGKVWQFLIDKDEYEHLDKSLVIHNIQDGDMIQVRYLSIAQPHPDAILMEANLEDAYLCLLKNM